MLDEVKEYINNQITLAKLEVVEKASSSLANVIFNLLVLFFAFVFFLLLIVVCGFWFSQLLESYVFGFLSASGIFFVLILLFLLFKKGIQAAFRNYFIRKAFESKNKKLDYD